MSTIKMPEKAIICQNYVNGKWTQAAGEKIEVFSPYNGKVIGEIKSSTNEDVSLAVANAKEASLLWKNTPLKERTKVMFNFRNILIRDIEQISHLVSSESGKTFPESRAEVLKGIEVLEFATSIQNLDAGGKLEVSRGVHCEYQREPLGVVASITPFNFPAMVPMWTIPIALTLGNAYIWKPSEKTPFTSMAIANALTEAGLPPGVFNVVQGDRVAVESILDHEDIKAVSFVGSTKIAKIVYQRASSHGKRALALGGAKNHIVLLPDANKEISGIGISDSFTGCAGQRCMAASVLLAVGDVDAHIEKIKQRAQSLELGMSMGAIITKEQLDFLHGAIEQAVKDGATLLVDGRKTPAPKNLEGGYWLGPTILDNVKKESQASKLELFGPIISIIRCKNIAEAIEIENENEYGNACSVFTTTGAFANRVAKEAKAGMVGINIGVPVPREPFSFGGINASKFGHGDITGIHSLNFWTDIKKVTTKWELQNDNNWMS